MSITQVSYLNVARVRVRIPRMRQLGNLNRRVVDRRHGLIDSVGGRSGRKSTDFIYLRGRPILILHYVKAGGVSFDV